MNKIYIYTIFTIKKSFRRLHQERQQLVKQWEATIDQMQRRDKEIADITTKENRLKVHVT